MSEEARARAEQTLALKPEGRGYNVQLADAARPLARDVRSLSDALEEAETLCASHARDIERLSSDLADSQMALVVAERERDEKSALHRKEQRSSADRLRAALEELERLRGR